MFKKEIITTAEDYKQLVYFTEFVKKRYVIPLIAGLTLVAVVFLILGLCNVIDKYIAFIIIAVLICVELFFPLKANKKAKDGIKYGKVALNAKRTLEYDTTGLKIYGGRTETDINMPWHTLFAIYELESCFIVYLTFRTAFVIGKGQLTPSEALDMRNYFEKQLQNRFYLKCKR